MPKRIKTILVPSLSPDPPRETQGSSVNHRALLPLKSLPTFSRGTEQAQVAKAPFTEES